MTLRLPTPPSRRRACRLAPLAVAVCAALALPAAAAPAKPGSATGTKAGKAQGKAQGKRAPSRANAVSAHAADSHTPNAASTERPAGSATSAHAVSTGFVGVPTAATATTDVPGAKHAGMNAAFVGMPPPTAAAATAAPAPAAAPAPTQVALALSPRTVPSFTPARSPARMAAAPASSPGAATAVAAPPSMATALARNPSDAPVTGNSLADPVIRLLHARGLLPSQVDSRSSALLTKVRDATSDLVATAMNFIGVRYTWGGTSVKTGFDCSGFTRYVFDKSLGVALPRRAADQARSPDLQRIDQGNLKPGDLVFFNTLRSAFSHVGIYVGDGKFIHAPRTGSHVRVDNMNSGYWAQRFNGARRAPQAQLDPAALEDAARGAEGH